MLLLNAVLTVRAHEPASHAGRGWEQFTDAVVRAIAAHRDRVVYMLWGSLRAAQGCDRRSGAQLYPQGGASVAAVGVPGFFRLPPLLAGERYLEANGRTPVVW